MLLAGLRAFAAEPERPGAASPSDRVFAFLQDEGFSPQGDYLSGRWDGFPYSVRVSMPRGEDAAEIPLKDLVITARQEDFPRLEELAAFLRSLDGAALPVNLTVLLTAADAPRLPAEYDSRALRGTRSFLDTLENPGSTAAVALIPGAPALGKMPVSLPRDRDGTPTPLWLFEALPFPSRGPLFVYRLGLAPQDGTLGEWAARMVPAAGVGIGAGDPETLETLFAGLSAFIRSLPDRDFSRAEGTFVFLPLSAEGGRARIVLREGVYVVLCMGVMALALLWVCFFPSLPGIIACFLAGAGLFDPAILLGAVILGGGLAVFRYARRRAVKTAFVLAPLLVLVPLGLWTAGFARRADAPVYDSSAIRDEEGDGGLLLEAEFRDSIELREVTVRAGADLPVIRCDISVRAGGANQPFYSDFPFTVDIPGGVMEFTLPESPPNPLSVTYVSGKNPGAAVEAVFFLDRGDSGVTRKTARITLGGPDVPPR
jgi:hypothetical protein